MEITLNSKYDINDKVIIKTPFGIGYGVVKDIKWGNGCFVYSVEFELGKYWFDELEIIAKGD